jgi:hypothetical protein
MENNNLETKSDKELISIYASKYPSPIDRKEMERFRKENPKLYNEMRKRRLFVNLEHIIPPEIMEEYEKIKKEDKEIEMRKREGIIKKYDLSLEKFAKIIIRRKMGIELKTKEELNKEKVIKLLFDMERNVFEEIKKLEEYRTLYQFQLAPLRKIILNRNIKNIDELRRTARSLKDIENEKGYESIEKLKKYMEKIYNRLKVFS